MNERVRKLIEKAYDCCLKGNEDEALGYLGYLLDDSIDFDQEPMEKIDRREI